MIIWIVIGVIALILIYLVISYNSFISMRNGVEEAFSTMDVYLKKRYDLIPNVVETVKGYAKHESETLENVIAARNSAMSAQSIDDKVAAQGEIQQTLGRLFALSESYPDLKANTNFMELQRQLGDIETEIAQSRKYYNGVVRAFNTKVEAFPSNIVAGLFKFTRKPLFEVDNVEERKNVKVEF
ncbi:LemA protein [Bacilli bacterium PM5-3]|nr:LemA protein [Bacilli bacterium PM5-3]MDH6604278.1 LemA protein [Bacilli bacterium PM5-9]